MKITRKGSCSFLILLLFILGTGVTIGNASSNLYVSTFKTENKSELSLTLNQVVKDHVEKNKFSGSVLVVKGEQIYLDEGYGYASRYLGRAQNTSDTKFLIGSMTKTFTALSILQLQDQGFVSVQDHVTDYFPEYTGWKDVTLHHLLTHTSGIPNYYDTIPDRIRYYMIHTTPEAIMTRFKDTPLLFAPGTDYDYSNTNYMILTAIIEKVSGKNYIDYLKKNVFEPAGFVNTGYEENTTTVPNLARGYCVNNIIEVVGFNLSNFYGAGGLYSTTRDLYQLSQFLDEQKLLNETNRVNIDPQYYYGYGMMFYEDPAFGKTYLITGGGPGINTGMYQLIDQDMVIIILSNHQEFNQEKLVADLYTAYHNAQP